MDTHDDQSEDSKHRLARDAERAAHVATGAAVFALLLTLLLLWMGG